MGTKKLKNFEYAYHSQDFKVDTQQREACGVFKTLNGYAFILCGGYSSDIKDTTAAELALERVSYYLDNEFIENPADAVFNALVYASGFIFEYARKNPEYEGMKSTCTCLLVRDNKAYYANLGNNGIYFFNGKKIYTLACNTIDSEHSKDLLLGESHTIEPYICDYPFTPVDNDILLLCSENFLRNITEKSVKNILSDPMPLLTKVSRLVDLANTSEEDDNASIMLISFYNIENEQRHFEPQYERSSQNEEDKFSLPRFVKHPAVNIAILSAIVIFFFYMVWDLFLKDSFRQRDVEIKGIAEQVSKDFAEKRAIETPVFYIPQDSVYVVRSGDSWSVIYRNFNVCSWFIRNHEPNAGKFRNDNPVAGTRINIPLLYSSDSVLNPDFYYRFTTDKVGGSCQNANASFLREFEAYKKEKKESK